MASSSQLSERDQHATSDFCPSNLTGSFGAAILLFDRADFVSDSSLLFLSFVAQITRDILWFCVILFIVIVLFSQMFFTLLAPDSCAVDATRDNMNCSQNEYYLKVSLSCRS